MAGGGCWSWAAAHVPAVEALAEGGGEIVALAPLAHAVAQLVGAHLVFRRHPDVHTVTPCHHHPPCIKDDQRSVASGAALTSAAVVRKDSVDVASLGGVLDGAHPELAHLGLRPVEGRDPAVDVAVVAKLDDLARLVLPTRRNILRGSREARSPRPGPGASGL